MPPKAATATDVRVREDRAAFAPPLALPPPPHRPSLSDPDVFLALGAMGFSMMPVEMYGMDGPGYTRLGKVIRLYRRPGHYEEDMDDLTEQLRANFSLGPR